MSQLRIWGNLTKKGIGYDRELTQRNDIVLNETMNSTIILLENSNRLVTGLNVGQSDVQATLAKYNTNDLDIYYSNIVIYNVTMALVEITEIKLYTFLNRNNIFEDLIYTKELLKMDVTFSDNLIIRDILYEMKYNNLWPFVNISDIFNFSSTDPEVVSVSKDGYVQILDNWWREVNITVTSKCSANSINIVFDTEIIYPNLKPDYWDVDIEAPFTSTGLQFSNKDIDDNDDEFLWNIYINATTGTLLSFSLRIYYDDNLFIENGTNDCSYFWNGNRDSWPQCKTAGDWEGQMLSWNIDTIRGELRLAGASSTGSSTNSSLQHVASCNFRVNSIESNISMVLGQIIEISYIDDEDNIIKHIYDEPIIAGDGYQQINNGQTVKPSLPLNISDRYEEEVFYRSYKCKSLINDEYIFTSNQNGAYSDCCDSNINVPGDVNLDCRHTAFDAQATSYYLIDTNLISPYYTIPLNELSYSQRIAMDPSLDYLQNDRNECSDPDLTNPCPNGLEDIWYSLQVSTGKFLYLNVSKREETLIQNGNKIKGIAPMLIQEYSNYFRFATNLDATVYFELKGVNQSNRNGFILDDSFIW